MAFTGFSPFVSAVAGYQVSDQDVTSSLRYFGYLNKDGNWYIMRGIKTGNVTNYTYVKGASSSAYATAWNARATQTYGRFDTIF